MHLNRQFKCCAHAANFLFLLWVFSCWQAKSESSLTMRSPDNRELTRNCCAYNFCILVWEWFGSGVGVVLIGFSLRFLSQKGFPSKEGATISSSSSRL